MADHEEARTRLEASLTREQCYLCIMSRNQNPPKDAKSQHELRMEHHDYLVDLEQRGVLFAAGPFFDSNGWVEGDDVGVIIIRADSRPQAEELAQQEPFTRAGVHQMRVVPWQRNEGSLNLEIRFGSGEMVVDGRTYRLDQSAPPQ